jgi:hypothetical protein
MANSLAPFGFRCVGTRGAGATPSFEIDARKIAQGNTTAIYKGDPVVSLSTGYITRATAGTTQIAGIFKGCKYNSASQGGKFIESPYWPGSDALGDVEAYIEGGEHAVFRVQANGSITFADVNANVNFALGTPNTSLGLSGAMIDTATINTTATHPFRIVGLVSDPPGENGTESGAYAHVLVRANFTDARSTTGI